MLNLSNLKRKDKKFKKGKETMKVEKKDLEEPLIKQIDTIDALWKPVNDHMDQKDH